MIVLDGQWEHNLRKEIDDNDYCFVCGNHPSHGHDKECPCLPSK